MSSDTLTFNGINGVSREYLLPPMTPGNISALIRGEERDEAQISELKQWYQRSKEEKLGTMEGVDSKKLEETGWGVIFDHNADPRVREHLKELLDHRREQATRKKEDCHRVSLATRGIPRRLEAGFPGAPVNGYWPRSSR